MSFTYHYLQYVFYIVAFHWLFREHECKDPIARFVSYLQKRSRSRRGTQSAGNMRGGFIAELIRLIL